MDPLGRVNMYICQGCSHETRVLLCNSGLVPSHIHCPKCAGGEARGTGYRALYKGTDRVTHCFFRPTRDHFFALGAAAQTNVLQGGLLLAQLGALNCFVSEWEEFKTPAELHKFLTTFYKEPDGEDEKRPERPQRGAAAAPGNGGPEDPQDPRGGGPLRGDAGQKTGRKRGGKGGPRDP